MNNNRPRLRQWPTLGTYTLANGDSINIPMGGRFFRVKQANAEFELQFDDDDVLTVGENFEADFDEKDKFKKLSVTNNSGGNLIFQVQIGDGQIRTNAITISGNQNVDVGADIYDDGTNDNLRVYDQQLKELFNGDNAAANFVLKKGVVSLDGATFVRVSNATHTIATAVANTGGVVIRRADFIQHSHAHYSTITVDGDPIVGDHDVSERFSRYLENYEIPAGVEVVIESTSASYDGTCWYEVR